MSIKLLLKKIKSFTIKNGGFLNSIDIIYLTLLQKILPLNLFQFLYSFDSYHRAYVIRKILKELEGNYRMSILDVGGGWGNLERSLKRSDIAIYDPNEQFLEIARKFSETVIKGYGENINIESNSYDIVISVHTLEHIPKSNRLNFISEMTRVSKNYIILFNPFGSHAEKLCIDLIRYCDKKSIKVSDFTLEHIKYGLPKVDEILNIVNSIKGLEIVNLKETQNYYMDRLLSYLNYIKIPFIKAFLIPIISLLAFLFKDLKPSTCLILVCKKMNNLNT
ncbi:MAG: class I SAM-dependent methyltransferase [Ignavibacteria bacterium]|nr:class I SAM-dependent methyltransferase [Ignavibacteria bacterium]